MSTDPQELLAAYKESLSGSPESMKATLAQIATRVGPGGGGGGGGSGSGDGLQAGDGGAGAAYSKLAWGSALAAGLLIVSYFGLVPNGPSNDASPVATAAVEPAGNLVRAEQQPQVNTQPPDATNTTEVAAPPDLASLTAGADKPTVAPKSLPEPRVKRPRAVRDERRAATPSIADDLRAIKALRKAVLGGHHSRALDLAARHRRDFAGSPLAKERDGLEIEARCGRRRTEAATQRAREYMRVNPSSSLADRVRAACGLVD